MNYSNPREEFYETHFDINERENASHPIRDFFYGAADNPNTYITGSTAATTVASALELNPAYAILTWFGAVGLNAIGLVKKLRHLEEQSINT